MSLSARSAGPGRLTLQLRFRPPLATAELLDFLRLRAIPGVEEVTGRAYRRSIPFGHGHAVVELRPGERAVTLEVVAHATGQLAPVVQRARRLMDLDSEPAIDAALSADRLLGPLVRHRPGLRLPGAFDGFELAVRAVLGQQISVAAATTVAGRLAGLFGRELSPSSGPITRLFPSRRRWRKPTCPWSACRSGGERRSSRWPPPSPAVR